MFLFQLYVSFHFNAGGGIGGRNKLVYLASTTSNIISITVDILYLRVVVLAV